VEEFLGGMGKTSYVCGVYRVISADGPVNSVKTDRGASKGSRAWVRRNVPEINRHDFGDGSHDVGNCLAGSFRDSRRYGGCSFPIVHLVQIYQKRLCTLDVRAVLKILNLHAIPRHHLDAQAFEVYR